MTVQTTSLPIDGPLHIGGRWLAARSGATVERRSPASGDVIGRLAVAGPEDIDAAVAAARKAHPVLAGLTVLDRSRLVHRIADEMERDRDRLARLLSLDVGKPLHTEAYQEVDRATHLMRLAAEDGLRLESHVLPTFAPGKFTFTLRVPRGVYAVITPWNFPLNIACEYLGPALVTGNAVVWKPSSTAPVVSLALMQCVERAEPPPGACNLLLGPGGEMGERLVAHPGISAVGLTGNSETGLRVARAAALKPQLMELGGKAPIIVLDDADLDRAAEATARASFRNAGQICTSGERILVSKGVLDDFLARLVERSREWRLGDPLEATTTMGPMNNAPGRDKVVAHIEEATRHGAQVVTGGAPATGLPTDLYMPPTILTGVRPEMLLCCEETFGPTAPLLTFGSEAEALTVANSTRWGLSAAIFTNRLDRAFTFAKALRVGSVVINDGSNYWEGHTPAGGASGTQSGVGRIGGRFTLLEMTELKTVVIDHGPDQLA